MILPPTWQSRQSDDIKQPNLHSCQPAGSVFLLPGRTAQPAGCCPKGPWSKIKLEVSHYTSVSSVPCKDSVSLRFPARILEWFSMLSSSNSSCRLWYFASSVNAVYLSIADSFLMAERVLIPRHLFMWFTNSDMAADGKPIFSPFVISGIMLLIRIVLNLLFISNDVTCFEFFWSQVSAHSGF